MACASTLASASDGMAIPIIRQTPPVGRFLIQSQPGGRNVLIGAREMLLDGADADAKFGGDRALLLALNAETTKDHTGPLGKPIQDTLEYFYLLPGDEFRLY